MLTPKNMYIKTYGTSLLLQVGNNINTTKNWMNKKVVERFYIKNY